jgi:hypothetical protein
MYDSALLETVLRHCGFTEVAVREFQRGTDPRLLIDTPSRQPESLYMEAWFTA